MLRRKEEEDQTSRLQDELDEEELRRKEGEDQASRLQDESDEDESDVQSEDTKDSIEKEDSVVQE